MIVQTAPAGEAHFIITQVDHARACGLLAAAFGNTRFDRLTPREPMEYVVAHHDEGWAMVDDNPQLDLSTGLPYHLTKTPILKLIETGAGSPDHNERHHPYSGVISSMHTWGLYHGRYGLSDKIFIDSFPAEHRPAVDMMLAAELERQNRLKSLLTVTDDELFHNYKLLQFFDTLGLYFHMTHIRSETQFKNVPRSLGTDAVITITPLNENEYRHTPYPFTETGLTFCTQGRYLHPLKEGDDLKTTLANTPYVEQRVTLVA